MPYSLLTRVTFLLRFGWSDVYSVRAIAGRVFSEQDKAASISIGAIQRH
jgi:hypothetical protein